MVGETLYLADAGVMIEQLSGSGGIITMDQLSFRRRRDGRHADRTAGCNHRHPLFPQGPSRLDRYHHSEALEQLQTHSETARERIAAASHLRAEAAKTAAEQLITAAYYVADEVRAAAAEIGVPRLPSSGKTASVRCEPACAFSLALPRLTRSVGHFEGPACVYRNARLRPLGGLI